MIGSRALANRKHVSVAPPSCLATAAGLIRFALREIGGQHRSLRVLEKMVKLRGYPVSNLQLAVTDLGCERSTLLLANQFLARAADVIDCYASCKVLENGSADSIAIGDAIRRILARPSHEA